LSFKLLCGDHNLIFDKYYSTSDVIFVSSNVNIFILFNFLKAYLLYMNYMISGILLNLLNFYITIFY